MGTNRITSFWLVLCAALNFALPLVPAQEQPGAPEKTAPVYTPSESSPVETPQDWLPALNVGELQSEYAGGVRAQKLRQYAKAALHFEQILPGTANSRDAQKRLAQTLKNLERQDPARLLESYYAEGVAAMARQDWRLAFLAFRKVKTLHPEYRDTGILLLDTAHALRRQLMAAHVPAVSRLLLDSLHAEATAALAQEKWWPAIVVLEKIQILKPGYDNVEERLQRAHANLQPRQSAEREEQPPFSFDFEVAKMVAALLLLPLFGYLIISPSLRARLHLLQGNIIQAMTIYEKRIAKNPGQIKYYGKLAQACVQLGRRDEFALKIYQIVLQLNLLNQALREKINGIVAQYYLAEGRHDKDALVVLEEALAYELHKQQNGMALIKAGSNGAAVKSAF